MLNSLIESIQGKVIAEVGVWRGDTSARILTVPTVEELVLIDPWQLTDNQFNLDDDSTYVCNMGERVSLDQPFFDDMHQSVIDRFREDSRVTIVRGASAEIAEQYSDGHFDLVFIDTIHLYEHAKRDIAAWRPKVRPGGILSGDDYNWRGVKQALDELECSINIDKRGKVWWWTIK